LLGTTVTSSRGPVKPGPNPLVSMSKATRVGVPDGSVPWSADPSCREKKGRAMATMMARAATADSTGCFCTRSAQLGQKPLLSAPTTRGPFSARFLFCLRLMTLGPMNPSIAGRRVRAATMVRATPMAAATARPYRKLTPRANMPSSAMHTMIPAKSTARPEVLTALMMDDSTSRPATRPWRWRVTMKRA
jgi:hypothetical protein